MFSKNLFCINKESVNPPLKAKGFTLIELLIVIAILAILATVVLIVINPIQMFAQARDSQRIYDMNTLNGAVALYLTTVASPSLQGGGGYGTCAANCWGSLAGITCNFVGGQTLSGSASFTRAVDGSGWLPVVLSDISGGSPLSALPKDPTNTTTYFYSYACDNTSKWFEFHSKMESCRYSHANSGCGGAGADDVEGADGGSSLTLYEVGNKPGLNL